MSKKSERVSLKMQPDVKKELEAYAKDEDRSINNAALHLIIRGLKNIRAKAKRKRKQNE